MRRIAKAMAASELALDALVSSPLARALQTAEIVGEAILGRKGVMLAEELSPEGDPKALVARLARQFPTVSALMLVGHEPYLSKLISVLLTGRADGLSLTLKKGGLCCLSAESLRYGQCAALESLLTPKQMIRNQRL